MTANRWVLCLFLAVGLVVSGYAIAQANRAAVQIRLSGQETGDAGESLELLSGNFQCVGSTGPFTDPVFGGTTLSLSGTAGITTTTLEVGGETFVNAPDAAKLCDALATSIMDHAQGLGCTMGQVRSQTDTYTSSVKKSFKLACHGKRDEVVQIMGDLSRKFLAESP